MRRAAAGLVALLAATGPAGAQGVDALLRELAPGAPGAVAAGGSVRIDGRVERDGAGAELVVTLTPLGKARLVADPGVQLTPRAGPSGPWAATGPVERVEPLTGYFAGPVELRVPVVPGAVGTARADLAYAWCLVDRICLLGEAEVAVPLAATGG